MNSDPDAQTKSTILEELGYTDLNTTDLVARVGVGISKLKPMLRSLEEAHQIKQIERDGDKVWRLL
jgi:DNA-binding MarR family transcriptional regulator